MCPLLEDFPAQDCRAFKIKLGGVSRNYTVKAAHVSVSHRYVFWGTSTTPLSKIQCFKTKQNKKEIALL